MLFGNELILKNPLTRFNDQKIRRVYEPPTLNVHRDQIKWLN
jgi:hypothetical protein